VTRSRALKVNQEISCSDIHQRRAAAQTCCVGQEISWPGDIIFHLKRSASAYEVGDMIQYVGGNKMCSVI
jgi:hypothetical protein